MSDLGGLFSDIVRFETQLWNAVDARLRAEFSLPLAHFEPLAVIGRAPGCRVYDIATELAITTGGVSKLVDRIEADGYCRRRPNPGDRRSSLLELTEAGRRVLDAAGAVFEAELDRLIGSVVPPGTLRQFAATLTRLRAASQPVTAGESG